MVPSRPAWPNSLERDAALGLEPDVDDGQILFDRDPPLPLTTAPSIGSFSMKESINRAFEVFFHCSLRLSQTRLHLRPVVCVGGDGGLSPRHMPRRSGARSAASTIGN